MFFAQVLFILSLIRPNVNCTIADSIHLQLDKEMPGIKFVMKSELVENWAEFLDTDCPTVAKGDFNGDGLIDYAFLTTTHSQNDPYQLLVAHSSIGSYELIKVMDIGFEYMTLGLGLESKLTPKEK